MLVCAFWFPYLNSWRLLVLPCSICFGHWSYSFAVQLWLQRPHVSSGFTRSQVPRKECPKGCTAIFKNIHQTNCSTYLIHFLIILHIHLCHFLCSDRKPLTSIHFLYSRIHSFLYFLLRSFIFIFLLLVPLLALEPTTPSTKTWHWHRHSQARGYFIVWWSGFTQPLSQQKIGSSQ